MHVAELLVSHGASLNAKTSLEETPIGTSPPPLKTSLCTSDARSTRVILKSCRRTCRRTLKGSNHGGEDRRVSDRRQEKEFIVWQRVKITFSEKHLYLFIFGLSIGRL